MALAQLAVEWTSPLIVRSRVLTLLDWETARNPFFKRFLWSFHWRSCISRCCTITGLAHQPASCGALPAKGENPAGLRMTACEFSNSSPPAFSFRLQPMCFVCVRFGFLSYFLTQCEAQVWCDHRCLHLILTSFASTHEVKLPLISPPPTATLFNSRRTCRVAVIISVQVFLFVCLFILCLECW